MPMLRRLLICFALLALALGCAAVPAGAQDPQVDPDSPAGTEYQLPTDRAREEASRGSASDDGAAGSATSETPLFGKGVEEKKSNSAQNPGTDSDPATTADVEADTGTATSEIVRAQAPTPNSGGGGLAAIGGGALGVLVLGGLAGLAWRRRAASG